MHAFATGVAAVMVHVADVATGSAWYEKVFAGARRLRIEESGVEVLVIGDLQLEIVPADDKVSCGPCGTVVYWNVADFDAALEHLQNAGATLYRGPLAAGPPQGGSAPSGGSERSERGGTIEIENGMRMCQVRDPWGNCIGVRGTRAAPA
jgi:predicted enzyme related to lactoylglutathione lyase